MGIGHVYVGMVGHGCNLKGKCWSLVKVQGFRTLQSLCNVNSLCDDILPHLYHLVVKNK